MAHQQIWGELVVVALKAEDLSFQNAREIDPFCLFRVGNVVKRTKADSGGGLHPIWDDQVNIPVAAGQNKLFVQIFNKDNNPVNLMADGVVDLNKVLRDKEHDGFFSLLSRGRPGPAKIYLEMTFYPSQNDGAQRQPVRFQQPTGYPPVNFRPPPPTQPMSHHTPVQHHRPPTPHSQTYHPPPPQQQQQQYRPPPQQVVPPPMQYRPPPPHSSPPHPHPSNQMGHSNIQHNRPPPAPIQTGYPPAPVQTGYPPAQLRPGSSYPPNPVHVHSPQAPSQPLLSAPYSPVIPAGSPHGQQVHHFPQPQPQPQSQPQYSYPLPQPNHNGPAGFHGPHRPPTSNVIYPPQQQQHNMVRPPPHQTYPPQQNYFPRPAN